jgi:hypothetical protein
LLASFTFTTIRKAYGLDVNYRKLSHPRLIHGAVAVGLDLFSRLYNEYAPIPEERDITEKETRDIENRC